MKIAVLVEGKTETAFKPHLVEFLRSRLQGRMPRLDFFPYDGRIPTGEKLRRTVENLLTLRPNPADAVIGLSDIYGCNDFEDAADAKAKMRRWAPNAKFFPHVAQYDFEAWLLPYWSDIQQIAGHDRQPPAGLPERVNRNRPPSSYIKEIFRLGTCRDHYSKARDANRILRGKDLSIAALQCPELRAFLNRVIELSGGTPV